MPRTQASIVVPGRAAEAEALFHDPDRWAAWVDGFGHVVRTEGDWPQPGAVVSWNSRPGGRGRVMERVTAYEPAASQVRSVEDETLRGTQEVRFQPEGDETRVTLALDFELKQRTWLGPLAGFFVKRSLADSLRRTLGRFAVEREGDLRPL